MSQVFQWTNHPDLTTLEQLIVHIGNLRTPTADQLSKLVGRSKEYTVTMVSRLNRQGDMVRSMKLKGRTSPKVYYLGKQGCQAVEDLTGVKYDYYEFARKGGQGRHTKGINDILIRLIEVGELEEVKNHCKFWNSRGAKQQILTMWQEYESWSEERLLEEMKTMLSPDFRFFSVNRFYWGEFDNDTKDENLIRGQFQLYLLKLIPIENRDPVVWIAKDERRRDELKRWWKKYIADPPMTDPMVQMVTKIQAKGKEIYIPEMHFFSQGEETIPLLTGQF